MYQILASRPSLFDRVRFAVTGIRDWLDERGKAAWIVAMILGLVVAWPIGLGLLAYMIWSRRMFGSCSAGQSHGFSRTSRHDIASTGNAAFDAYREETLKRLEAEHAEFVRFLAKLREARDKAEFDQFMDQRHNDAEATPQSKV